MSDSAGTNLPIADARLLDDACDEGDSQAGLQQPPHISSTCQRNSCQFPVPKRIKYVYCEHCLRYVSEKTYRSHCNLHFPCRDRDLRVDDDQRMMQENADPGMLLYCEWC